MGDEIVRARRRGTAFEPVRCLGCGSVYAKPHNGGTASCNPGCPDCGYVGWAPYSMSLATVLRPRAV